MPRRFTTRSVRSRKSKCVLAAIIAAAPMFVPSLASATNRTWLGGLGTGNWNTPGLWTGGILPGPLDDTFIANSDTSNRTVIQNAGNVVTRNLQVNNTTQIGTNVLIMPANNSINTFLMEVGTNGKGEFINDGGFNGLSSATLSAGGLMMGGTTTGRGFYTLNNGGFLTVNNGPQGGTSTVIGKAGFATFTHNNGNASFNSSVTLAEDALSTGTYIYNGGGSAILNVGSASLFTVGSAGGGTFVHNGGPAYISKLRLGNSAGGRGLYLMNGGNLNINTAAQFQTTEFIIGLGGDGTFSHSGGNVNFSGPRGGNAGLNIGEQAGSTGTYLLSGTGVLNVATLDVRVGYGGAGHFLQTGGSHTSESVYIGSGNSGRYVMSGNGTLNASRVLSIQQTGSMTQSGGLVNVGNGNGLLGAETIGQLNIAGAYQLSGGTLNVNGLGLIANLNGGTGTFQQTGGTHNVSGIFFVGDLAGLASGAVGTYTLSGGRLNVTPKVVDINGSGDSTLNGFQLDTGGTIVGGATDGIFSGKMTQQGGTIAGTFRNEGQIVSRGGALTGALLNRKRLTMDGGTLTVGSIAISNEANATVDGAGAISGTVNNLGAIKPTGALAIANVFNTTNGTIYVGPGTSLGAGLIDNRNTLRLDGGSLSGASGQIFNNGNAPNGGALISGGGLIEPELVINGGIVRADLPNVPLVIKAIDIEDPASQFVVAPNCTLNLQPSFVNGIPITLQGSGARLLGGVITNANAVSIKGAGEVANRVLNSGVIRAENGELVLSATANTNVAGGQIQSATGTAVSYTSGLASNAGAIQLTGGEFNNNGFPLANNGSITGRGTLRAGTITNNSLIFFSGGITDVFAPVTNSGQFTVTGNGATTLYNTFNNTASGNFTVTLGSTAVFFNAFTGLSTIGGPGTKDFEAVANTGAIDTIGTTIVGALGNVTTNFIRDNTLDLHGRLTIVPNGSSASVSRIGSLLIQGGAAPVGTLNLNNNDLILTGTAKSLVQSQISFARHSGAWDRAGITTAAAAGASPKNTTLGVLSGQQFRSVYGANATFGGFTVADSDVLVKYTYYGDTDFNGIVNFDDYSRTDSGFNIGGSDWFRGDFDFNGHVDFDDYSLIDLTFNTQGGTLRRAMSYLEGGDRSDDGMNTPALRIVQDHFHQFGQAYASSFLAAVPEPSLVMGCFVFSGLPLIRRRRTSIRRAVQ